MELGGSSRACRMEESREGSRLSICEQIAAIEASLWIVLLRKRVSFILQVWSSYKLLSSIWDTKHFLTLDEILTIEVNGKASIDFQEAKISFICICLYFFLPSHGQGAENSCLLVFVLLMQALSASLWNIFLSFSRRSRCIRCWYGVGICETLRVYD